MKVVKLLSEEPYNKRDYIINWYPRHLETAKLCFALRDYGLFRDEHQDWNDEMKRLRYLRGKIPPKRGEGKNAMKKKAN
jgi:small subunit ribosomal protein S33